jgi:RHS repeat-associated protein
VFDLRIGRLRDTTSSFDFVDAAIERYVLDGGDVVLDFVDPDGSGSAPIALAKRYLHGEAVDQIFAQEDVTLSLSDANRTLWFLTDDLGTVRDLMRGDGTIAAHFKFEAFGKPTSGDTSKTRFFFTSREFDPATGLQYNRARWYDSATGRWISEDPIGFAAGDANMTRYVGNTSTGYVDPSGLIQDGPGAIGGGANTIITDPGRKDAGDIRVKGPNWAGVGAWDPSPIDIFYQDPPPFIPPAPPDRDRHPLDPWDVSHTQLEGTDDFEAIIGPGCVGLATVRSGAVAYSGPTHSNSRATAGN